MNAGIIKGKVDNFLNLVDKLGWEKYTDGYTGEDKAPSVEQKGNIKKQAQTAYADAQKALQEMAQEAKLL